MTRFSWLRYARQLFWDRRIKEQPRIRRRLVGAAARIEGLANRWLLSGGSLAETVIMDEISPGIYIQRTSSAPTVPEESIEPGSKDATYGPVFGSSHLNGNGLEFNFTSAVGMPAFAITGFQEAANLWSSIFTDDIIINIDIDFTTLGAGILGSTFSERVDSPYATYRTALGADVTSVSDTSAVANLQGTATTAMLLNRTSDNPNGSGDATPYLDSDGDQNNSNIWVTRANAKAAGVLAAGATESDAQISFSDQFTWDFDRSDGITPGAFDFVGVAAHEIGHALGFVSGVDILDGNSPPLGGPFSDDQFIFVTPLDLFRFSADSVSIGPGVFDWTADTRTKYFSVDGGTTALTTFSLGRNFGDGQQASHWEDSLEIGIMDPTADLGEFLDITDLDIQAFDVIGWDVDNGFNVSITESGGSTDVAEGSVTDTYTIGLTSVPTGAVEVTVTADAQTEISVDGTNFFSTRVLSFADQTTQTITVRAIDDLLAEGVHSGTITHAITASGDADYPTSLAISDVTVTIEDNELAAFERLAPLGSLISESTDNQGTLQSAADSRDFTFFGQAGQTFSASVDSSSNVLFSLQLLGVSGLITSPASGSAAVMPPQAIPSNGTYTLRVTASAASDFSLAGYLNTALESILGDSANGTELPIDSSELGSGIERYAVIGNSTPTGGGPLTFTARNNLPLLFIDISATGTPLDLADDEYRNVTTTVGNSIFPAGPVSISNNGGIISGFDEYLDYANATLPNVQFGNALLPFWDDIYDTSGSVFWEERVVDGINTLIVQWNNRPHISAGSNTGTFQLQLFADGPLLARYAYKDVNFNNVTYNNGASATVGYQQSGSSALQFSFNLASLANNRVLDLARNPAPSDVDEYTLNLNGKVGQPLDILVTGLDGANYAGQTVELLAPNGTTVLATGVIDPVAGFDATNLDLAIAGFVVPADGVYTIRVTSTIPGSYSLVVTDSLVFDTELNDSVAISPLRDIVAAQDAMGYLGLTDTDAYISTFSAVGFPFLSGFTFDNWFSGMWHLSQGRSNTPGHSAPDSLYFGFNEGANGGGFVDANTQVAGRAVSPPIDLTGAFSAALDFNYLFDGDSDPGIDIASVQISTNGGSSYSDLVTKLPLSPDEFTPFTIDLSPFIGNTIRIRFSFDTVTMPTNFYEGWYIDDVVVRAVTAEPPDSYAMTLAAGQRVTVATFTPFDNPAGSPLNDLNPELRVIHPNGVTIVAADQDSGDGKNAQLSFIAPVAGNYQIQVAGTSGAGEYLLHAEIDLTAPQMVTLSPPDDSTGVAVTSNLIITFNEFIAKGTGNILVRRTSDNATVQTIDVTTSAVTVGGSQLTVDLADLASTTGYYILIPSTAVKDLGNNFYSGISSTTAWNFTTVDVVPPIFTGLSPLDNSTNVPVTTNLVMTFDEPVAKGVGNFIVKLTSDNSDVQTIDVSTSAVTVAGNQVTVDLADLGSTTDYYVIVTAGAIVDAAGNPFAGISSTTAWNFVTADVAPPLVLSLSPTDNALDIAITTNLVLTFNEDVVVGTGDIVVMTSIGDATVQTINVTSPAVTVVGSVVTIDLANLTTGTGYYVLVPNTAIEDLAGNAFAGISATTAWNFTTSDNQLPIITSLAAVSWPENTPASTVILDVDATDSDVPSQSLSYLLTGPDAALFSINSAGEIRFLASPNYELPTDQGSNRIYNIIVNVTDNGTPNLTALQAVAITITPVNDNTPSITSSAVANVVENTSTAVVVLDVNATDADVPAQTLSYSLSGPDLTFLSIDSSTGQITFNSPPDYDAFADANGDDIYEVTVTVADNDSPNLSTTQDLLITVTDFNDNAPVVTSLASASVPENTLTTTVVLDVNATDADLPGQSLTYGLSGTDAGAFTLDEVTGELRFAAVPDYEVPTDQGGNHVYDIIVTVSDNGAPVQTRAQPITITVTAVNDNNPVITSGASATRPENTSVATVVLDVNATDADLPGQGLTYELSGTDAGAFLIDDVTGEIRFANIPDYEVTTDQDGNNVYLLTVTVTDDVATARSTSQSLTITVTPLNDNQPAFTSSANVNVPENISTATAALDVNAIDADQPAQALSYTLAGQDRLLFSIDAATGEIRFLSSPDFEAPADFNLDNVYDLTVTATDNGNPALSRTQTVAITVTAVNDNPPVVTSSSIASIQENSPLATIVRDVNATDADVPAQLLSYVLSGTDADLFDINSTTGQITFKASPNYEIPGDQGGNNIYEIIVTVTDNGGAGFATPQTLTITVTDVNEAPTDLNLVTANVAENQVPPTVISTFTTTDADAGETFTYALVAGAGSTDNGLFSIAGNQLRSAVGFDYETKSSYSIRVRSTDKGGLNTIKILTITVVDANDRPTDINLSANTVIENQPANVLVGQLSSTDQDVADTFTYAFVSGSGSNDNASFIIVGNEVRTAASFNFENQSVYSVRIQSTDAGGLKTEKVLFINILDVNEQPTSIGLVKSTVAENQPAGSVVSTLNTTDQDLGDTFTYELISGVGSDDNASFVVVGGQLQTVDTFDFEGRTSYSIRLRSTDSGNLTTEKVLTVGITNLNEQPLTLSLVGTSVPENQPVGTFIGTFSTTDIDIIDTFTYSLVLGTGDTDNGLFSIVDNELRSGVGFDFEARSNYSIRVRTRDAGGLSIFSIFTITVTNVNDQPTDLALSNNSVAENLPAGTTVGTFSTSDIDPGDTFTYSLATGLGNGDNGSFVVVGNQLQTAAGFNFEAKSIYSVRIRTTDQGGLNTEKVFTVNVTNVNESPTDIVLAGTTVAENQIAGTIVGTLSTSDPDFGSTFTYSFVSGAGNADNSSFAIVAGQIQTTASFDFETKSSYSIRLRSTDGSGLSTDKVFTIGVTNTNDAPSNVALTPSVVPENVTAGTVVGALSTTDQDLGDTFTYNLVPGVGSADNSSFTIAGSQIKTSASFNFEGKSIYSVRVRSIDGAGLMTDKILSITVSDVNEAPASLSISNDVIDENQPTDTLVGTFSSVDPDTADAFTYSLVAGTGSGDNAAFTIMGDRLLSGQEFDFESKASYSVRVRTTDANGLFAEQIVTIQIADVSDPPEIQLTPGPVVLPTGKGGVIDLGADVLDQDSTNFQNNRITVGVQPSDQQPADRLRLIPQGKGTDRLKASRGQLKVGKTVIGTVTGGRLGEALSITFAQAADGALVQRVLNHIGFRTRGPNANPVHIEFQMFDGEGNSNPPVVKEVDLG